MRILITAGGTREYIDPVRFISNASSGRMGCALARAALKVGHKVTLVTVPVSVRIPDGAKIIKVETAAQMFQAVKKHFVRCDCLIMAAAVADYTPVKVSKAKMKKGPGRLTLELKPTIDILAWAGRHKRKHQLLVGFALEDKNLYQNAEKKLKDKNLDIIIANTPKALSSEISAVYIKVRNHPWRKFAAARKAVTAPRIITLIEAMNL
jgi:phosphopantothenoylcysteine decarboxylase/phosphopantothenate--cysteine ligase